VLCRQERVVEEPRPSVKLAYNLAETVVAETSLLYNGLVELLMHDIIVEVSMKQVSV
jgi:hypothetical protein